MLKADTMNVRHSPDIISPTYIYDTAIQNTPPPRGPPPKKKVTGTTTNTNAMTCNFPTRLIFSYLRQSAVITGTPMISAPRAMISTLFSPIKISANIAITRAISLIIDINVIICLSKLISGFLNLS